jgi:hypothetical protein
MSKSEDARARAETTFKRKQEQAHEGAIAWAEYEAERLAVAEKTKRLRALRLAKEAAESEGTPGDLPGGGAFCRPRQPARSENRCLRRPASRR